MLYRTLLRPLLFRLPPETAHELALHALSNGAAARALRLVEGAGEAPPSFGELRRFGLKFKNPVGLAAGFDKNGVALRGLASRCIAKATVSGGLASRRIASRKRRSSA